MISVQPNLNEPTSSACIGIVAGWGEYPCRVAQAVRDRGHRVAVAAIRSHASEELKSMADFHEWVGVCKLGRMQRFFKIHDASQVCLAGKLFKDKILYHGWGWIQHFPDLECWKSVVPLFLSKHGTTNDDRLLGSVVDSFLRKGMTVIPGTDFATELLAEPGVLTRTKPSRLAMADIEFGWKMAKQIGGMDIGQAVTVLDRTILAVEAVEGTDACIERTGILCPRGGFALVKVAKPQQDMRFDLPTIGPQTIERMAKAGGRAIAIESGKTILLDRVRTLQTADARGICIVSM